ncbi:MAG: hypothetical protein IKL52_01470 [Candidatus Gastranaerophilales bacterium]|nr:hypothetical protein [Candidatus Gastranaerophilales bacterium]
MKIQSVFPFAKQNYKYNNNYNFNPIKSLACDTFSFSGRKVEDTEIALYKRQALNKQLDALELVGKSKKAQKDAQRALGDVEKELSKAKSILIVFNKNKNKDVVNLKNGNQLKFEQATGDNASLTASECDSEGNIVRIVRFVNSRPVEISTFVDGAKTYKFNDKTLTILNGIENTQDGTFVAKESYEFVNLKLTHASTDLTFDSDKQFVANAFMFKDGALRIYARNSHTDASRVIADDRYVLDEKGKLISYYKAFEVDGKTGMISNFDECYHFNNDKFNACAKNVSYDPEADEMFSNDAYYLKDGEFVHTSDFRFSVEDEEMIRFRDCE